MRRTKLNSMSPKRRKEMPKYYKLIKKLRGLCENRSEISGNPPDWQSDYLVEPHHIGGRNGHLLMDPFNIIMVTRPEHDAEETKIKPATLPKIGREKLFEIIEGIRIRQGFIKENFYRR